MGVASWSWLLMAFLLSLKGDPASRFGLARASLFRARPASSCTRCLTCLGSGPFKRAVGWSFPRVRSTMPVSSRGPRRRRSWWCHTPLIDSQYPNPCEAGGVIRCGLQARLDMGLHGVPRGCQVSSQSCNGLLAAQLSDRPADSLRPQTSPGHTPPVAAR